jgi:hypothetical protein
LLIVNYKKACLLSKNVEIKIYKSIILPVVLYGCETWAMALREEHRLRVLENIDEIIGVWKKYLNEERSSPDIIRMIKSKRMTWAG